MRTVTQETVDHYRGFTVTESKGGFLATHILPNGQKVTAERESLREVRAAVDFWHMVRKGKAN